MAGPFPFDFDVNVFAGFSVHQVHHATTHPLMLHRLINDHRAEFGNNLHHQSGDVARNGTAQMFTGVWVIKCICP